MTLNWLTVLIRCRHEPRILLILLAIIRLSVCFLPQTGYMHPDEFFQSPDIVGGTFLKSNIQPVWEFKTETPIRCMVFPYILNNVAFKLAFLLQTKPSAYLMIVAPRFVYTLLSFAIDFCLYKLCQCYSSRGLWYLPVSVVFQTSFITLGCLTRTFSNSVEVAIFASLLVVVCQTVRPRFRIMFVTPTRSTPVNERVKGITQVKSSILIGVIIMIGTFNRPTFPCFALIPTIYWFLESLKRNSYNTRLTIQRVLVPLTISAALTSIPLSAFDTIYYRGSQPILDSLGYLTEFKIDKFYSSLRSRWVLTPYNFVCYNTSIQNLSNHGLHLPYVHMVINIPLAFNLLGLLYYKKLFDLFVGSGISRLILSTHRVYALMLLTILSSTILLSFVPHQEFRFLLPIIVPLVYIFSFNIYTSNKLLTSWLIINLVLFYFYSNIHQSGVTRACLDLDPVLKSISDEKSSPLQVSVIALNCYIVPSYQWNLEANDDRFSFDLQDTFENFELNFESKMGKIFERQRENPLDDHHVYVMLPRLYESQFIDLLGHKFNVSSELITPYKHYSSHFSEENLGKSLKYLQDNGWNTWTIAFGFSLIRVNLDVN